VTRNAYLRSVGYWLRDLPWSTRRDLLAELGAHLDELPADTDFGAELGSPEAYAADMRAAAGLERRRGVIAFLRARRPRNLILFAVALAVIGLAIGVAVWVDSYQPIATGNTAYDPLGSRPSPAGDGIYVVFHQGKRFRYGMTIWNRGRYTVRVLGVPDFFRRHLSGLPASVRLLLSAPTTFERGGMPGPFTRFRPFDLKPGEQRGLVFTGVFDLPCRDRGPGGGSDFELSIPVRYRFLWHTATADIALPERLAVLFLKSSACRATKP
jgi:hypothetical protein